MGSQACSCMELVPALSWEQTAEPGASQPEFPCPMAQPCSACPCPVCSAGESPGEADTQQGGVCRGTCGCSGDPQGFSQHPGEIWSISAQQLLSISGRKLFQKIPTIHRQPTLKQRGKCPKIPQFKRNFRRYLQPVFEAAARTPEEETKS